MEEPTPAPGGAEKVPRAPRLKDLSRLCAELNRLGARRCLPDQAVNQLEPGDVEKFIVVRVGDEILVDLMKSSCGVDYAEAIKDADYSEIDGVSIPFASPRTLWRMKQTKREKDVPDRLFLRMLLESQGHKVQPATSAHDPAETLVRWIQRLFGR